MYNTVYLTHQYFVLFSSLGSIYLLIYIASIREQWDAILHTVDINEPVCVKQRKSRYVAWGCEISEELRSDTFGRLPGNSLDDHNPCYSTSMWMGWCNFHLYHHSHSLEYMSLQWRSQPGPASYSTAWQSVSICLNSRYAELSTPRRTPTVMLFPLIAFTTRMPTQWSHATQPGILRIVKASPLVSVRSQQEDAAHFGFHCKLGLAQLHQASVVFDKFNT